MVAGAVALAGCGADAGADGVADPALDTDAVRAADLRDDLAEVVTVTEDVDAPITAAVRDLRAMDELVSRLRSAATFDAALAEHDGVVAALRGIDLAATRADLRAVARAVDRARATVAAARRDAKGAEVARLDAEDELLVAVRALAEANDALAQVVVQQLPAYTAVADVVTSEAGLRGRYRTVEEAAAAFEVAVGPHLRPLADAQVLVARFGEDRDAAARAVNEASRAATAARAAAR